MIRLCDPRCFELAEYFLQEEPDLKDEVSALAKRIEEAVEDWIEFQRAEQRDERSSAPGDVCDR